MNAFSVAFGGKAVTHMFSRGKRNLNGSAVLVGTEYPMGKLKAILSATTLIWFVSAPSSAMPFSAQTIISTDWNIKSAQLVCDQFGRCSADAISTLCLPFRAARRRSERRSRCRAPICCPLCASL